MKTDNTLSGLTMVAWFIALGCLGNCMHAQGYAGVPEVAHDVWSGDTCTTDAECYEMYCQGVDTTDCTCDGGPYDTCEVD